MQKLKTCISFLLLCAGQAVIAQNTKSLPHFNKVIVSPHIEVTFIEGSEEKVTIDKSAVSDDKINIKVKSNTLRIYLDDAKEITKSKKTRESDRKKKVAIYHGTLVTATVVYKNLQELSIRGEQVITCKTALDGKKFKLKAYGEPQIFFDEVNLGKLKATLYGESNLVIKAGTIKSQKYTSYGESRINSLAVNNNTTKITAYGDSDFQVNVTDQLRLTAFGETAVSYKGNPAISKRINIGKTRINRIN